ncbi:protein RALF-like 1-like [Hibiscus syriacus]|uniref:Protein RALF-like 1-like n=1 Tax=Hibiscus syriacus TaxID=106335 RepID=A0A6A3CIY9_HIBSY|nr:protein RALF-like 1-like [Hibiscus syriacus]
MPASYAFPAMGLHYNSWEHHSLPFSTPSSRIGSSDQPSNPPISQRSTRSSSDVPRPGSFMHPVVVGHSSGARTGNSVVTSLIPPYPGSNARARDRVQALQAYYQPQLPSTLPGLRTPIISSSRRSSSHRNHVQAGSAAHHLTRWVAFISFHLAVTFKRQKILYQLGSMDGKEIIFTKPGRQRSQLGHIPSIRCGCIRSWCKIQQLSTGTDLRGWNDKIIHNFIFPHLHPCWLKQNYPYHE